MQDVIDALHVKAGEILIGEIALDEFNGWQVIEIAAPARHQRISNTYALSAPNEFF